MKHETLKKLFNLMSEKEAAEFIWHMECISMKMGQVIKSRPQLESEYNNPQKVGIYAITLFQLQGAIVRFLSSMFFDTEDGDRNRE